MKSIASLSKNNVLSSTKNQPRHVLPKSQVSLYHANAVTYRRQRRHTPKHFRYQLKLPTYLRKLHRPKAPFRKSLFSRFEGGNYNFDDNKYMDHTGILETSYHRNDIISSINGAFRAVDAAFDVPADADPLENRFYRFVQQEKARDNLETFHKMSLEDLNKHFSFEDAIEMFANVPPEQEEEIVEAVRHYLQPVIISNSNFDYLKSVMEYNPQLIQNYEQYFLNTTKDEGADEESPREFTAEDFGGAPPGEVEKIIEEAAIEFKPQTPAELKLSLAAEGINPDSIPDELLEELSLHTLPPADLIDDKEVQKTVEDLFETTHELLSTSHLRTKEEAMKQQLTFVTRAAGDKMWQLHKENPDYWTGERLGRAFGVPRGKAWGEVIVRECAEALEKGLPFRWDKGAKIMEKELRDSAYGKGMKKKKVDPLLPNSLYATASEEQIYDKFVEESTRPTGASGLDDELPAWAKYPFQPSKEEFVTQAMEERKIQQLPLIENKSTLGTLKSRYALMITEMNRSAVPSVGNRSYLVKEKDETLRTATDHEIEWLNRKGTTKRTRFGLGSKGKRETRTRRRQFEKLP